MTTEMRVVNRAVTKSGKELNFSAILILPMLEKSFNSFLGLIENVYVGDYYKPEFSQNILVMVNSSIPEVFNKLMEEVKFHKNLVNNYECGKDLVMLVFSVPKEFEEDYQLFLKGRYSKFSIRLKNLILGKKTSGKTYDFLYKTKTYREWLENELDVRLSEEVELLDPPNLEMEIYNYK